MIQFGDRLYKAMSARNVSVRQLADALKVSYQAISRVIHGDSKTMSASNALAASRFLHINPDWLTTGEGSMEDEFPAQIGLLDNPDYPAIRRARFKLSAGASGFGVEYPDEEGAPIVFQRGWYDSHGYRPSRLFAVDVANGSMEPGLRHGDTVVVNTDSVDPKDGRVFAVNYEGELVIKRLVRDAGSWWLSSDNPDQQRYQKKLCDENCIIVGEIVHKQSEHI